MLDRTNQANAISGRAPLDRGVAAAPDDELDLRELLRIPRRRLGVVFGSIATITALAVLIVFQLTPLYTAETRLMVETRQQRVVDVEAVMSGLSADNAAIQSEADILRSRSLAGKVVDKLNLTQDPEFNPGLLDSGSGLLAALNPRNLLDNEWVAAILGRSEEVPLSPEEQEQMTRDRVISNLLGRLSVTNDGRTYSLLVRFESENPRKAARVANAIADAYLTDQLEAKFEATQRATGWLNERLEELRESVRISEAAVQAYREQNRLIEARGSTVTAQQLSELNTQISLARAERAQSEARLRRVQELLRQPGGVESAAEVLASPLIVGLRQQEADLLRREAELATRYGDRHPRMINIRAEVRDLKRNIENEVNKIVQALTSEVEIARAREGSLTASLSGLQNQAGELGAAEVRLRELEREAEANRTLYETFLNRFKQTSEQDGLASADARVISAAVPPVAASFPNKRLLVGVAFVFSIMFGLFLAFLIERLDNGLRSTDQVERLAGVPGLGLIPELSSRLRRGMTPEDYVLEKPTSAFGESVRTLRTGLLLSNVDRPPKVILVTSAVAGEGKTVLSISLARTAARSGQKVILIDCDLRRPRVHKALATTPEGGLIDLLSGQKLPDQVITVDPKSGMHYIPVVGATPNPPDMLGSQHMRDLLAAFAQNYDLVVLDSPPVMAVSDSLVLSRMVDATVFAVRWERTPRSVALAGVRQVLNAGGRLAGVVLTQVNVRKHAKYGYGDAGYYYGRYRAYYTD